MAAARPNFDKYSTALTRTITSAAQISVQRLIAYEVSEALHRAGPHILHGGARIPLRVTRTNLQTTEPPSQNGRAFRVTVDLFIDEADLQDLQRY